MSSALSDLTFYDAVNSGSDSIEGKEFLPSSEDFGPGFKKALAKDHNFRRIWEGGPRDLHLRLKKQIDYDKNGRLLYNGKPYNKDTWCCYYWGDCQMYGPPKVIRQQGRPAKEQTDEANTHPEIIIFTAKGEALSLDACPCGGELIMDDDGSLYCKECGIFY